VKALIALYLCFIFVSTSEAARTFVLVHGAFEDGSVVVDPPRRPSHPAAGLQEVSAEKHRDVIVEAIGGRAAYLPKDGRSLQSLSAARKGSKVRASSVVSPG
jgi:hypothetical protein